MGWASYIEDITRRLEEASRGLTKSYPTLDSSCNSFGVNSGKLVGKPMEGQVPPGEWLSIRQRIESLLRLFEGEVMDAMTDPNFKIYEAWQKVKNENIKLKLESKRQAQQIIILQRQLKEQESKHQKELQGQKETYDKLLNEARKQAAISRTLQIRPIKGKKGKLL